jgi:poly(3-hydroxybutyrate) depolymerase
MPTARVHFTDVNFTQAFAEGFQNQLGLGHRRIYLPGMSYIKTKPRFGKLRE